MQEGYKLYVHLVCVATMYASSAVGLYSVHWCQASLGCTKND